MDPIHFVSVKDPSQYPGWIRVSMHPGQFRSRDDAGGGRQVLWRAYPFSSGVTRSESPDPSHPIRVTRSESPDPSHQIRVRVSLSCGRQVLWRAYPFSSGAAWHDYYVADPVASPPDFR